ncbi:MAG: LytTR family transcriptional regulator [Bacteroidales bacterium]|nr:LytTR family transcriptional regulator [Bacteroidales bacterium]
MQQKKLYWEITMQDEYLILSPTRTELLRIASVDILYIHADGNSSDLYLTNGEKQTISMQLGEIENTIKNQLKKTAVNLVRIGKSHIINRTYIYKIDTVKQHLILSVGNNGRSIDYNIFKVESKKPNHTFTLRDEHINVCIEDISKDQLKALKAITERM